jgi:beta-lactamase regulating signal transducer with metallopeptidase domain/ankyrin repeat protein
MLSHSFDFFQLVLEASWQTSPIILLILLVRFLMGPRIQARWLSLLWLLVLIRLLVPITLFPASPVSLQNIALVDRPLQQVALVLPSPAAHEEESGSHPVLQGPAISGAPSAQWMSDDATFSTDSSSNSWWITAASIWLTGTLIALFIMIGARFRLSRRLAKNRAPVDPAVAVIWDKCCQRLRIRRAPRLRMSPDIGSPALVGLIHPVLLLPEGNFAAFSGEDWENVFVHELAHYQRADHWTHALQQLALALHWFNPVVWLGFRLLRADRELAADEWALRHLKTESSSTYGNTLLKILAESSRPDLSLSSVGILEDRTRLKQRLERIVAFSPRTLTGSLLGMGLVACMGVLALGRQPEKTDLTKYDSLQREEILVLAARTGDLPAVREMLRSGVKVDATAYIEANNQTALIAAASTGRIDSIKLLLSKGADINLKIDHQTDGHPDVKMGPVETAYKNGFSKCASYLISRGAICDPSLIAAATGNQAKLKAVLAREPADVKQLKLLCKIAAANGQADSFRLILKEIRSQPGDSRYWRLDDGSVVVSIARGNRAVVQAILDSGETLNKNGVMRITGPASETPGMREWLISKGFTVPVYNDGEKLIDATEREDIPEMERLLKAGTDVNYRGDSSWTPITKSAAWDRAHAMKFLFAHGADPNSIHIAGSYYTPLCLTSKPPMADMVLAAGGDINGPLFKSQGLHIIEYAVALYRTEMVKWYLDHGVDPAKLKGESDDATLLFDASNAEIAELLIQHGVDVNTRAKDGRTALYEICERQQDAAGAARVLLQHGADPNAKADDGSTPIKVARNKAVIDVLVEFGAKK